MVAPSDARGAIGALAQSGLATGRIVRDRLAPGPAPVPLTSHDITPAWLTTVLAAATGGRQVARVHVLDDNAGTTHHLRLGLEYAAGATEGAPATAFCKLAPTDFKTRLFVTLMGLGQQEVAFYRHARRGLPVDAPVVYAAVTDRRHARFCLLLEDLEARRCGFATVLDPCPPARAHRVMAEMGRLHGAFWDTVRFDRDLAWVPETARDPNAAVGHLLFAQSRRMAFKKFPELVPERIRRASAVLVSRRQEIERAWAAGPPTLLHGDPHIGNLYFDGDDVGFLDWQVVRRGPALRDVTYFLILSMEPEVRRAHQEALLGTYLGSLADSGGPALPFETTWERYRALAPYPWIAAVVTAAAGTLQVADIAGAALARSTAALIELDAFDAVAALLADR